MSLLSTSPSNLDSTVESNVAPKTNKMEDTKYLPELLAEKDSLDSSFTHAMKLLSAEIQRIQTGGGKKEPEKDLYLDLFATKNLKLKERILIPTKLYPRVNFVGKLLGPQGSTIKRLQEDTGAKISVLGKGSMRDKNKEEELRNGGEAKYAHLSMELHVFIEVMAPIPEGYLRMAHAMEEVKKFLIPEPGEYDMYPEGEEVDHQELEDPGDGECPAADPEERCVELLHEEDQSEAPLEVVRLVGVVCLLRQLEEAQRPVLDLQQQVPQECSPPQPCPINRSLQGHRPSLTPTRNIHHTTTPTQRCPTRDMTITTANKRLQLTLSITTTDTAKHKRHRTKVMVKTSGTVRGQTLPVAAKCHLPGRRRDSTETIPMEDTEHLLVESC
uniref:KH domain-containing, RNA-binding, signal transduction-associated protein 1 n=1 Tax=Cynoglossus semilaevis TaxID=244447 RepID=A0A3P8UHX4_CYNSE